MPEIFPVPRSIFGSLIFKPGQRCPELDAAVSGNVRVALTEDLSGGNLCSAISGNNRMAKATLVALNEGVVAGTFWVDEVFRKLDPEIDMNWLVKDGEHFRTGNCLCQVQGSSDALLAGERCALNFLHTLSAAATTTAKYVKLLADTKTRVTDTRKTLPGLRIAQKYAVVCGGGTNQRHGLYDGILIKDNHIRIVGTLSQAVAAMRKCHPGKNIEAETETLEQVEEALCCGVEIIMLDNFSLSAIKEAVALIAGRAVVEASGEITLDSIAEIAACNVDYISVGALTKHVRTPDISMRLA